MAVYLVTYDLNRESVRPDITKVIHHRWNWAMLSESSYAVDAGSADEVFKALEPLLDDNDNLFVIPLKKPYSGKGEKDVHDWLAAYLTF